MPAKGLILDILRNLWRSTSVVTFRRNGGSGGTGGTGRRPPQAPEHQPANERRDEEEQTSPATGEPEDHTLRSIQPFIGQAGDVPEREKQTIRIEVPTHTILKIIGTLVIIWLLLQVLTILLLLLLAGMLCLALLPPVRRLEHRGMPRVAAAGAVYLVLALILAGFFGLIVPPLVDQVQGFVDDAPGYVDTFGDILDRYPTVRDQIENFVGGANQNQPDAGQEAGTNEEQSAVPEVSAETVTVGAGKVIAVATGIVGGVANAFFVIVLAFYLLIEGERTWRYFARYMRPHLRYRFHRLGPALTHVVSGYVIGQAINSTLFGLFTFIALFALDVPQPLLLAILAALMDAIPIVGVPIATIATMALAATVSWQTSLIVLGLFLVYQQFENYVLLPRVFGNTLQVSGLSILVGVLVGGQLLGVLGIILSLPLAASIPVIERIWREVPPDDIDEGQETVPSGEPPSASGVQAPDANP